MPTGFFPTDIDLIKIICIFLLQFTLVLLVRHCLVVPTSGAEDYPFTPLTVSSVLIFKDMNQCLSITELNDDVWTNFVVGHCIEGSWNYYTHVHSYKDNWSHSEYYSALSWFWLWHISFWGKWQKWCNSPRKLNTFIDYLL